MSNKSILAERLRAARKALFPEVTQKDVAVALDRSASAINLWEAGKTEPSADDIVALSRWYKVTCDWLLGASDVNGPPGPTSLNTVPIVSDEALVAGEWRDASAERLQTSRTYNGAVACQVGNDAVRATCPPGSFIVIQPSAAPRPGQLVMATVMGNSAPVLRRLVIEGGPAMLVADDNRYPTYHVDTETKILGVVKEVTTRNVLD
ncbi:LexA family transcriptional regulator [Aquabacterium sp.]|uniref:LexA family transcriptional regulator n=1 Tax=Aquabacterium sp. TaxID=1872578 RepID=UPI00248A8ED6|nr:LexA family transcriptional regulator [Aquabacterium sp.]MDI1347911.1 LexA family transcriptional regulator [Aquabacterium sp.]